MRRKKRRPKHYCRISLCDGTILAAYPVRKPTPKVQKRDKTLIDSDGISDRGRYDSGMSYSTSENRFRFQNIMASRLNTRRAIREIVMPEINEVQKELQEISKQLEQLTQILEKILSRFEQICYLEVQYVQPS